MAEPKSLVIPIPVEDPYDGDKLSRKIENEIQASMEFNWTYKNSIPIEGRFGTTKILLVFVNEVSTYDDKG